LPGADETYNFATNAWEANLPGENRRAALLCIAGRLAAVTSSAADPQAAQNFLLRMASSELSAEIAPASAATTLFRRSQMATAQRWVAISNLAQSHAETLAAGMSLPRSLVLRLPGRERYLGALDAAVLAAIKGTTAPEAALAAAAAEWSKITGELGRDVQRRSLRRELSLENIS
jgi:multiple sugar transport system substrate-binding protein